MRKILVLVALSTVIFRTNAEVIDSIIPNAVILLRGTMPDSVSINIQSLMQDIALNARQQNGFAIWEKQLSSFSSTTTDSRLQSDRFPDSIRIVFAISANRSFFAGVYGKLPYVLSVINSFYWEHDPGARDASAGPNGWIYNDEGIYEPKDIALSAFCFYEFSALLTKGFITKLPSDLLVFRNSTMLSIKHRFPKDLFVLYYPILIVARDNGSWVGAKFHDRWCQFQNVSDNGAATRSFELSYYGANASYVYASTQNNNGENCWVKFNAFRKLSS